MEPFAISIRVAVDIQGFKRAIGEEKIALYADDVLLFLVDTQSSLSAAMEVIENVGQISGLRIHLEKSRLLPVDPMEALLPDGIPKMEIVKKMEYLGIQITTNLKQYISNNLAQLIENFKSK